MSYRIGCALTAVAILVATASLSAHHSFAAVFDASKRVTLTGRLTKVDWRNPHIAFSLDAKGDRGQPESWVIEAGPPNFFQSRGIAKSEFEKAVGQPVTVEAVRARNGSLFGSLLKITFPNGKSVTSALGS
jgi:hypothetical protein